MNKQQNRYTDEFKSMIVEEVKLMKSKIKELEMENDILKKRLTQEIIRIYHEQDGIYGAPKIRQELLQLNLPFQVSKKTCATHYEASWATFCCSEEI